MPGNASKSVLDRRRRVDDEPPVKVLVVDDTPRNLLAATAVLETLACEVLEARSGAQALEIAAGEDVAAILLDVMMPDMDGFETLARLRSLPTTRHTPVIFLTAYDLGLREIERAYKLGANDCLLKPVEQEVLRGKVGALVALHRAGRELRRSNDALEA